MDPFSPLQLKRLRPAHMLMIRLHGEGKSNQQIADELGYSAQQVCNVLACDLAQEIIAQLHDSNVDSMMEVVDQLNEVAPKLLNKMVKHALHSPDERVSLAASRELLHMAGHSPIKRVHVDQTNKIHDKYRDVSEEDLRSQILQSLRNDPAEGGPVGQSSAEGGQMGQSQVDESNDNNGPDGKPLN